MGSVAAKKVAREVSETLRKGKRPVMGKIIRKAGYSKQTSLRPKNVTETKSYKDAIANDPFVKAMIKERDAAIKAMVKKRGKAKYRDLVDGFDKFNKNIQLATGGKTDNTGLQITWE